MIPSPLIHLTTDASLAPGPAALLSLFPHQEQRRCRSPRFLSVKLSLEGNGCLSDEAMHVIVNDPGPHCHQSACLSEVRQRLMRLPSVN